MQSVLDETQQDSFEHHRRRSIVIDYLLATSTHGLRSVGRAYSTANRVFWIIVFSVTFTLMLYFVTSSTLQYFAYPTKTNVEIRYDGEMVFPAVTVCNAIPYRLDKMNAALVSYFYQLYPSNTSYNQSELDPLTPALVIDMFNKNETEQLVSLGFQLSDMLLSCSYNGIDCSQAFVSSLSAVRGNCYTFNWKTATSKLYTLTDFGNTLLLKQGLSLAFYMPTELNFPTSDFYDIGLMLLVHDNNELPLVNENGIGLQPGMSHLITYRKSETTFLPSPYTACTSEISADLHALYQSIFIDPAASTYTTYSESVCRNLCAQAYVFSQCSCILTLPYPMRYVHTLDGGLVNANCCTPSINQGVCAYNAQQRFAASDQLQTLWCSHCVTQCTQTIFTSDISSLSAPTNEQKAIWLPVLSNGNNTTIPLPTNFSQNFDYYFSRNFLKVFVACGNRYVTVYQQDAQLTIVDTFAAVGGQMGLWIGLSIVSIIELSEVVYRLAHKHYLLWKDRRRAIQPQAFTMNTK